MSCIEAEPLDPPEAVFVVCGAEAGVGADAAAGAAGGVTPLGGAL
jgi:hypothetical protein